MIYTVSKKLLLITSIISLVFIFGCNKKPQSTILENTGTQLQETGSTTTENIFDQTGEISTTLSGETIGENTNNQTGTTLNTANGATTGEITELINEYKAKNKGNSNKLNENDIELMEKVIDKIDRK